MKKQHWLAGTLLAAAVAGTVWSSLAAQPVASAAAPTAALGEPFAAVAHAPAAQVQDARLNLNTATREQFLTVPNVGDRVVREFFEYRPYTSILQFRREIGKYVSADQVAAYEQYVFVPVSPNNADADTLQQLPGVDVGVAAQLVAARPYASADDFVARLGQLVTADQAALARSLLSTP